MLKIEQSIGKEWSRTCDTCRAAPSTVYCRADFAYFCSTCDTRIHGSNQLASRHERVRICEACECAPAAFLCKADAVSLCTTCDCDIHSANPLAQRHHRVPIFPVIDMNYGQFNEFLNREGTETDEAASWPLMNPVKNGENGVKLDEYLDLDDFNSCQNEFNGDYGNHEQHYSCVPHKGKDEVQQHCFQLGLEYEAGYNYADSISHRISLPQMGVGIVPESTRSEGSISHSHPPKGTIDLFSGSPVQTPTQLSPMDRMARVLRYREKKKSRKFAKTIRYASRKAYAEARPRIKGRFAKRNDAKGEVDQMFSTSLIAETTYSVVPSFDAKLSNTANVVYS